MSSNRGPNELYCSLVNAEDEDKEAIKKRGRRYAATRFNKGAFHCCQACAWREEELRQERRIKQQTTLLQKLGQKFVDSFLLGRSFSFTTRHIAVPLYVAVLLLLLCDESNLVEGFGTSSGEFQMESNDLINVICAIAFPRGLILSILIAFPVVLKFNLVKSQMSRSSGLTNQQLKYFRSLHIPKDTPENKTRKMNYAHILSKAIQCKTVSSDDTSLNVQRDVELKKLHSLLLTSFPTVYEKYPPITINEYSLIFKIPGQDPKKKPIMLCAHLDVVSAPTNEDYPWVCDPFSGDIVNGIIHGRGAIDNKHNVVGQLGAMEEILRKGDLPKRTTYISMGHDEEIQGFDGAAYIAQYFKEQKIQFEFILDEGTMIISGAIPGIPKDEHIALVGCVEKGMMCVELSVKGPGGHSSIPPIDQDSPLKVMGKAIVALESNQVPAHFEEGTMFHNTLKELAGDMSFPLNILCSNFWLFGGLFKQILVRASNGAAASVRTTTAVTKVHGGEKYNIIASEVKAIVNHRIHPNDTVQSILDHDRRVINDPRVDLRLLGGRNIIQPSPVTNYKSSNFKLIRDAVQTIFDAKTVPGIMVGNTDTRWYWDLSDQIFRFSPVKLTLLETKMFHGVNEKISTDALSNIVDFYKMLVMMEDECSLDALNERSPLVT